MTDIVTAHRARRPGMVRRDVDDRPPTPYTRLYVKGMWLRRDKSAFEGAEHTLEGARSRQRSGDAPPTWWTRRARTVEETRQDEMKVWTVRARGADPTARVLYLHGGGYVHPLTKDYWRLIRALSSEAEVVVPAYPLAPDNTVDRVLPMLVDLASSYDDGVPLVLMGDSAGGALVLAVAGQLRDRCPEAAAPTRLVLLSPWLDATLDEEQVKDLEASDPMLAESGLRAAGRWWAGERDPADPLVSPVNADLRGLPTTDVFVGDADILRPAVEDRAEHAERDSVDLRVHEVTAMFHVWMTRAIPEASRTRRQLRAIVGDASRS